MYLSILGKPTDTDLERDPAVHLAKPHEWDPSVLDYTDPSGDGGLLGPMTLERDSNEVCLSTKDATSIVGCNSGLHAGKGVRGRCPFPSAR